MIFDIFMVGTGVLIRGIS